MSLASLSASCRSFRPSRSQIGPMGSLILRNNQPLVQEAAKKLCFNKTRYDESPENEWIFGSERDNTSWLRMLHRLETVERSKKIDFAASDTFMVYKSVDGSMKKIDVKDSRNESLEVPCDAHVVQVACGKSHFLLLGSKGEVFSFGRNLDGECGLDASYTITMPTIIPALLPYKVVAVSTGYCSSAVVTDDGKLITFGESKCSGHGGETYPTPTVVASLDGYFVEMVAKNGDHNIVAARDEGGRQHLFGFGAGKVGYRLFGDETGRNVKVPTLIPFFEDNKFEIVQLSTSIFWSIALTLSEQVIIWGCSPPVVVTLNNCTFSLSSIYDIFVATDKGETYSFIPLSFEKREISVLKGLRIEQFCLGTNSNTIFVRTSDGQILKLDSSREDRKLSKIVC